MKDLIKVSLLILLTASTSFADQKMIRVAVIDTGIDKSLADSKMLCPDGHKDFTGYGLNDVDGHGTHVAGLIHQNATNFQLTSPSQIDKFIKTSASYCQVIIKFYDGRSSSNSGTEEMKAIQHAIDLKVDVINISAGGTEYSTLENIFIKRALDAGITVVTAAGNNGVDLAKKPYYPASLDDRLIVVGNIDLNNHRVTSSNYGTKVKYWEVGYFVTSLRNNKELLLMNGTSQATAVKTGKIIKNLLSK